MREKSKSNTFLYYKLFFLWAEGIKFDEKEEISKTEFFCEPSVKGINLRKIFLLVWVLY